MAASDVIDGRVKVLRNIENAGYRILERYIPLVDTGLAKGVPPERITGDLLEGFSKSPIQVLEKISA